MKHPSTRPGRHLLRTGLLMLSLCGACAGSWAAPPIAAPSQTQLFAGRSSGASLAQLAALQRQAQASIDAANALGAAARNSQTPWQDYQAAEHRLQAALQQANACLPPIPPLVSALDGAMLSVHQALMRSHTAVKAIARANNPDVAGLAQAAKAAFVQRDAAELELRRHHTALQQARSECMRLNNLADRAYRNSESAARRLAEQARLLIDRRQTTLSTWEATQAAFEPAAHAPPQTPIAAETVAEVHLALASAPRWAPGGQPGSESPSPTPVSEDLLPSWVQWARQQDAAAYLDTQLSTSDCPPEACAAFTAERRELTLSMTATLQRLNQAIAQRQQAPAALTSAVARIADLRAGLANDLAPLATALPRAATGIEAEAQAIAQAAKSLLLEAQAAHAQARARQDRRPSAGMSARPPSSASIGSLGAPRAAPAPDPAPVAMAASSGVSNHAFELFSELDGEIRGFGAYTYVMVRSKVDMNTAPVRARFVRLLETLQVLPSASAVATDVAKTYNVFCVPVLPGSEETLDPTSVKYASDLGQQIKMRAQDGLLTQSAVRHRLSQSPGPFLITLPSRLSEANASSPVLIADLSGYPEEAIADLARHYRDGLVDDFPTQQALWKPPVLQRVALFMIHMAEGTGELITSAMPTAQATTPQR